MATQRYISGKGAEWNPDSKRLPHQQQRSSPAPAYTATRRQGVKFYWDHRLWWNRSLFPHQPGTPGKYYWITNGLLLSDELGLFAFAMDENDFT